jgi:all-trans-retinol dehydrogenase (NAD+)
MIISILGAEFRNRSKNLHVTLVCPYYINTAMFNGVKSSSPLVLPILSVDYVADRTIDAIETNTGALYLPRFCYFTMVLKELLPPTAGAKIAKLVGIDKELNQFFCSK